MPETHGKGRNVEHIVNDLLTGGHDSSASARLTRQAYFHETGVSTISQRPTDTQRPQAARKQGVDESGGSVQAVFDISELLIMVLSNLSTRDLIRSLTVSKYWRDVILHRKSKELRRILFLETAAPREYLKLLIWKPAIVREPDEHSIPIVEMHPILLSGCVLGAETYAFTSERRDDIRAVPPSTYLFRQPVEEIQFGKSMGGNIVRSPGGVTFGTLQEELVKHSYGTRCWIFVKEVIPSVTKVIESARIAEAVRQLFADKEIMSPEVSEYNMVHVCEGRPAVHEAEFERLKVLGRAALAPATT